MPNFVSVFQGKRINAEEKFFMADAITHIKTQKGCVRFFVSSWPGDYKRFKARPPDSSSVSFPQFRNNGSGYFYGAPKWF
jgi:hypothetical protein